MTNGKQIYMKRTKQTGFCLFFLTMLVAFGMTGCNGGNLNVGYSPASGCANVDLDPADCQR